MIGMVIKDIRVEVTITLDTVSTTFFIPVLV